MVKIITEQIIKSDFKTNKLVSCSLFRQLKVDKSPIKYYNGLRDLIKIINKYFSDFVIRVYIDLSVIYNTDGSIYDEGVKLLKELKRNPKVEVFVYRCSDFALNNYYHDGTFGSLVRLLPLFEKSKYKIVWHSDLDLSEPEIIGSTKKYLPEFLKGNADLYVRSFTCYPTKWIPANHVFNIVNYEIISKIKYPKKLLTNYLEDIKNGNYKNKINIIKWKHRTQNKTTLMPYGIDELFTNTILYNYIMKHKVKVFVVNDINLYSFMNKFKYYKEFKHLLTKDNMLLITKMYKEKDHKERLITFNKLNKIYKKIGNKLLKNNTLKHNKEIDKRYLVDCYEKYEKNIHKLTPPEFTFISYVN
jgi:hypothetical protein